jgi:Aspartyl protease
MNHLSLRIDIKLIGCLNLALITVPILQSEPHCPGNIASVTPRFVQHALIVIPVWINQSGPYDFMVDTGSQVTVVDPALARELNLKPLGTIGVFTVANYAQASITVLDRLEVNSHVVEKPLAIVRDFREIQAADSRIRGALGENFLAHFDLLIDYTHKLLCLDETRAMRERVRGEHIPLVTKNPSESELPFGERVVVSVHLSGVGTRELRLQLDSGSDGPLLYAGAREGKLKILDQATRRGANVSKAQRAFAVLPPQDMRIGSFTLGRLSFVTPVTDGKDVPSRDEDGLLPTLLFQRVFISGPDHYVVLDSR